MDRQALERQLRVHEGLKVKPYRDTVGKITIGIGRNLDDVGISPEEALHLLNNDIDRVERVLPDLIVGYHKLDDVRQRVLADMCFNLGQAGLKGFARFINCVNVGNFSLAAREMLDSRWAKQVGRRAQTLARMMETGKDEQFLGGES
ncbi:MAG: glycoside hydrolase family protein [Magnetococcales bacterium]|nr:glycoside hydrolase family protein [Magnetococcales bacterium]